VIGDKVQLRFFAKVGMPEQGAAQPAIEAVAFERLDLSGTYEIGEDGTTALPLIGRLDVAGQDLTCLEAMVANAIAAEDNTVSAVTATYSARLPVTISGAVRAPGTYVYAPGMTVNRLINQAGATFIDSPITPQEYGILVTQRNELQRRQILAALALGRVKSNISGAREIDITTSVLADSPNELLSPLIAAETAALQQDLAVGQMTLARNTAAIAGLSQKLADTRKQLTLVDTQVAILQERLDQMQALKTRGLLQASNPDVAVSSLMELNRIKLQLETDQSNLSSQIDLAEQDARLAVQLRKQGYAQQATQLSGEISLLDIQRSALETRLETHGFASIGKATQALVISLKRSANDGV
jgi:protein involved in polysaccharide export with SLBB domain